jgi:hypothetical protein
MNIDDLKKSSYLKRTDVARPQLVTIDHCEDVNVAKEGDKADIKRCIYFKELEKPLVGNDTNREAIASITGNRDDDHWEGHKVVLYDDPNVRFGTKLTGGIRVRAPKVQIQPGAASMLANAAAAARAANVRSHADDPKHIGAFIGKPEEGAASAAEDDEPF